VRVRRGRFGPKRRQQADGQVDPFWRDVVADAGVHLDTAERGDWHGLQGGQRVLLR